MRCIEPLWNRGRLTRPTRLTRGAATLVLLALLSACGTRSTEPAPPAEPPAALPVPPALPTPPAAPTPSTPMPPAVAPHLGPPQAARNWDEFKLQAARRLLAANPDKTYAGPVPEPLLAIPVLEVELNADGSVRRIQVLRHPRQAKDTTQLAIDAVHRAAPYGNMARLPKPWKWSEVFLFDDDRRFKPRTLDL